MEKKKAARGNARSLEAVQGSVNSGWLAGARVDVMFLFGDNALRSALRSPFDSIGLSRLPDTPRSPPTSPLLTQSITQTVAMLWYYVVKCCSIQALASRLQL